MIRSAIRHAGFKTVRTKGVRSVLAASLFFMSACATAELKPSPDASTARTCAATPVAYCDAMPPGAGGCVGDPDAADIAARQFATDASFPVGCTANLLVGTPDGLDCIPVATCRCSAPAGDAGSGAPPAWSCAR